jgi:hypothetical protein
MDANTERYYRVLNLEPTASQEDVYQAYRDLVRVWDPQRFANQPHLELMAEEKLKEIIEAYHALADRPLVGETPAPSDGTGLSSPVADHNVPAAADPPKPPAVPEPSLWSEPPRAPEPPQPVAPRPSIPQPEPVPAPPSPAPPARHVVRAVAQFGAFLIPVVLVGAGLYLYDSAPSRSEYVDQASSLPAVKGSLPARPSNEASVSAPHRFQRKASRPSPALPPVPPEPIPTGTNLMTPRGRSGAGRFRISNQSGQDAVVRVATQSAPGTALRLVYIQAGTDVTIGGIGTGVYVVGVSLGPMSRAPRSFDTMLGPFQFMQIESEQGAQSDDYQLVLKP